MLLKTFQKRCNLWLNASSQLFVIQKLLTKTIVKLSNSLLQQFMMKTITICIQSNEFLRLFCKLGFYLDNKDNFCFYFIICLMKRESCALPELHCTTCRSAWEISPCLVSDKNTHGRNMNLKMSEVGWGKSVEATFSQLEELTYTQSLKRNSSYSPMSCGWNFFVVVSYCAERSMFHSKN